MIGGNIVFHQTGFTLRVILVDWRTSSMDEKMTWLSMW